MAARNPLANVRTTTFGIIGLTGLWTLFQILDSNPPAALDQILVALFAMWFADEAKRNTTRRRKAAEERNLIETKE